MIRIGTYDSYGEVNVYVGTSKSPNVEVNVSWSWDAFMCSPARPFMGMPARPYMRSTYPRSSIWQWQEMAEY